MDEIPKFMRKFNSLTVLVSLLIFVFTSSFAPKSFPALKTMRIKYSVKPETVENVAVPLPDLSSITDNIPVVDLNSSEDNYYSASESVEESDPYSDMLNMESVIQEEVSSIGRIFYNNISFANLLKMELPVILLYLAIEFDNDIRMVYR